jgi:hypothetical protein
MRKREEIEKQFSKIQTELGVQPEDEYQKELEDMLDRYYKDREQRLNNMHKNK